MGKRNVVIDVLEFRAPAYIPWAWAPTFDCADRLKAHLGTDDLGDFLDYHLDDFWPDMPPWEEIAPGKFRDPYGVVWDRTVDRDIGTPCEWPLKEPADLDRVEWPDAGNEAWYTHIREAIAGGVDGLSRYCVDFSLFERAWTMRGMSDLLMDMVDRPGFVDEFLDRIVEYNLLQIRHALACGVEAVYFGDDYGMQTGLIMGLPHWRRFIKPRLARMFEAVREAGRYVMLHSCGCVTELFDDLVEIGLNVFNPFQPEVMDVFELKKRYHGRLAFHGGMSIQKTLPFGTESEVREMTARLVEAGREGGFIFATSHGVPRDVPPENLVAMVEVLKSQPGYRDRAAGSRIR
ncbi:MAG: uroporphyrinogen-III decarboxylase-like protein [Lentisphaerae bacterium]|nr:uroporphyrinogen-III decarboxylase-like protein [Lentisphaerota bacterium]